jgi:hypothetical protein
MLELIYKCLASRIVTRRLQLQGHSCQCQTNVDFSCWAKVIESHRDSAYNYIKGLEPTDIPGNAS